MKYYIEQFVEKIKTPVKCMFDENRIDFNNGKELSNYQFDKPYDVDSIWTENSSIVIKLEASKISENGYTDKKAGETQNWIEEHKEKYGYEPNLFDGA